MQKDVDNMSGVDVSMNEGVEEGGEGEMNGVYVKAFCQGVSEILNVYKEHLLAIEHEYLLDRSLTIPQVQQKLAIYHQMFPALASLMEEDIEGQSLKGGQLLEAIARRCVTGNPVLKAMFTKLLYHCNRVLLHQINAWIVHGQLVDLCEEFFINKINHNVGGGQAAPKGDLDLSKLNKSVGPTSVGSMSNLNIMGTILTMNPNSIGADDDAQDDEWNTAYTIRITMLPTNYLST